MSGRAGTGRAGSRPRASGSSRTPRRPGVESSPSPAGGYSLVPYASPRPSEPSTRGGSPVRRRGTHGAEPLMAGGTGRTVYQLVPVDSSRAAESETPFPSSYTRATTGRVGIEWEVRAAGARKWKPVPPEDLDQVEVAFQMQVKSLEVQIKGGRRGDLRTYHLQKTEAWTEDVPCCVEQDGSVYELRRRESTGSLMARPPGFTAFSVQFVRRHNPKFDLPVEGFFSGTQPVTSFTGCEATCAEVLTTGQVWTGEKDGTLRIWNAKSHDRVLTTEQKKDIFCTALLEVPGPGTIWAGFTDGVIRVFNARHPYEVQLSLRRHASGSSVFCLTPQIGGHCVFSGGQDGLVYMWDANTLEWMRTFSGHAGAVRCLLADADRLYSGSDDGSIAVWDVYGRDRVEWVGHSGGVHHLVKTDLHIWTGGEDGTVRVWDLRTGECVQVYKRPHEEKINSMALIGDKVWSSSGASLFLWDARDIRPDPVGQYSQNHTGYIKNIVEVHRSLLIRVWTTGKEGKVQVWNTECSADWDSEDSYRSELEQRKQEVVALKERLQRADSEYDEHKNDQEQRIAKLRDENDSLSSKLTRATGDVATLRKELEQARHELADASNAAQREQHRVAALSRELGAFKARRPPAKSPSRDMPNDELLAMLAAAEREVSRLSGLATLRGLQLPSTDTGADSAAAATPKGPTSGIDVSALSPLSAPREGETDPRRAELEKLLQITEDELDRQRQLAMAQDERARQLADHLRDQASLSNDDRVAAAESRLADQTELLAKRERQLADAERALAALRAGTPRSGGHRDPSTGDVGHDGSRGGGGGGGGGGPHGGYDDARADRGYGSDGRGISGQISDDRDGRGYGDAADRADDGGDGRGRRHGDGDGHGGRRDGDGGRGRHDPHGGHDGRGIDGRPSSPGSAVRGGGRDLRSEGRYDGDDSTWQRPTEGYSEPTGSIGGTPSRGAGRRGRDDDDRGLGWDGRGGGRHGGRDGGRGDGRDGRGDGRDDRGDGRGDGRDGYDDGHGRSGARDGRGDGRDGYDDGHGRSGARDGRGADGGDGRDGDGRSGGRDGRGGGGGGSGDGSGDGDGKPRRGSGGSGGVRRQGSRTRDRDGRDGGYGDDDAAASGGGTPGRRDLPAGAGEGGTPTRGGHKRGGGGGGGGGRRGLDDSQTGDDPHAPAAAGGDDVHALVGGDSPGAGRRRGDSGGLRGRAGSRGLGDEDDDGRHGIPVGVGVGTPDGKPLVPGDGGGLLYRGRPVLDAGGEQLLWQPGRRPTDTAGRQVVGVTEDGVPIFLGGSDGPFVLPSGPSGQPMTASDGRQVIEPLGGRPMLDDGTPVVCGRDGRPLCTPDGKVAVLLRSGKMEGPDGQYLTGPDGRSLLSIDDSGLPTDQRGPVDIFVTPDGKGMEGVVPPGVPVDQTLGRSRAPSTTRVPGTAYVGPDGKSVVSAEGRMLVGADGHPVTVNADGMACHTDGAPLTRDELAAAIAGTLHVPEPRDDPKAKEDLARLADDNDDLRTQLEVLRATCEQRKSLADGHEAKVAALAQQLRDQASLSDDDRVRAAEMRLADMSETMAARERDLNDAYAARREELEEDFRRRRALIEQQRQAEVENLKSFTEQRNSAMQHHSDRQRDLMAHIQQREDNIRSAEEDMHHRSQLSPAEMIHFYKYKEEQYAQIGGLNKQLHVENAALWGQTRDLQDKLTSMQFVIESRPSFLKVLYDLYKMCVHCRKNLDRFGKEVSQRERPRRELLDNISGVKNEVVDVMNGNKWLIGNMFTEYELLHIGTSPSFFVPDAKRFSKYRPSAFGNVPATGRWSRTPTPSVPHQHDYVGSPARSAAAGRAASPGGRANSPVSGEFASGRLASPQRLRRESSTDRATAPLGAGL